MLYLLILGLVVSARLSQAQCVFGQIDGAVFENAPDGTLVSSFNVSGEISSSTTTAAPGDIITLGLGPEFSKYFELDGKSLIVKDSAALDRSNIGEPIGNAYVVLEDYISCDADGLSTPINSVGYIQVTYRNKNVPVLTSPSVFEQSEITAVGTVITTLTAGDGDNTGYPISVFRSMSEYFEVEETTGDLRLIKELNYDVDSSIQVQITLTDTGVDELGMQLGRSSTQSMTVQVLDYDKVSPIFLPCSDTDTTLCIAPLYKSSFIVGQTGALDNVEPQAIKAIDGDRSINTAVSYSIDSGSPGYENYFEIDGSTGVVTVVNAIPQEEFFVIAIKASQVDNPTNRFAIAYLQVTAYVPDDFKPVISNTAGLSDAFVVDDGSEQLYVEDASGKRIQLSTADDDGDATLVYMIDPPEPFQILSNGLIFASRSDLFSSTRATIPDNYTITAINIDASTTSPNRVSDPVILDVTVIEMTTAATTEATTFPETTQVTTSIPITTTLETTEQTTLETTAIDTTVVSTTDATTSVEPTTFPSTAETTITTEILPTSTAEISTSITSAEPTTTDETTVPETTTFSPTEATTVISTFPPTTRPEITTVTTVIATTEPDTTPSSTTISATTLPTYTSQTTDQSTTISDAATTPIGTTEPSTTQQSSSPIPVSTLQTYTSVNTDETSVASSTVTMSTTVASEASVASTSSVTTVAPVTSSSPFDETSAVPSPVETTTTNALTTTPSINDFLTSTAPTKPTDPKTTTPEDVSTARPVTVATTDNQPTKDGTVIVDTVPKSTLIGVAVGLSIALFIAIIVIIFLLWKLMKKDDKTDENVDKASVTSSQTHVNDAYTEEDETMDKEENDDDKELNGDVRAEVVGFSSGFTTADTEESGVDMRNDPDNSSRDDTDGDFAYEPAVEPDVEEAVKDLDDAVSDKTINDEIELTSTTNTFEQDLMDKATVMAATAAATALVAKAVEEPPESEVPAEITPNLSSEDVTNEEVIKEDVYHSVKLVMLKGRGDDGFDVKAVLKTIDTDMSTSADVNQVRKRISIMEELSEMDHPNILKYYGCFVTNDTINYALKYAENGNLRDKLKSGLLSSHDMMLIMANIGKGLQYLHAKNITHGNVWSKAVMLDGTNTPMLTDIQGSSRASSEYKEIMRWQAAEVLNLTSKTTPATDVWSFGVLMWEIVSQGATPYKHIPLQELSKRVEKEQLKKPKGCSDSLFSVMENCWKKNPKLRDDMYGINNRLSELLLEDSNEHIQVNEEPLFSGSQHDYHQSDGESSTELTAF